MPGARLISPLLLVLLPPPCIGHVQIGYPPAIIDDDYQYTFDGSCQRNSCDAFCGVEGPSPPLTTVSPGLQNFTVNVNVKHPPFMYRVSLSSGPSLGGFDTNILLDNIANPGGGRTEFNVTVDIPDITCDPYCTIQLFDYYYFVSCANILVGSGNSTAGQEGSTATSGESSTGEELGNSQGDSTLSPALPSKVNFSQETISEGEVLVSATVTLADPSWFAVALSPSGSMIGARAIIGLPRGADGTVIANEYDLDGKFTEAIRIVDDSNQLVALSSSFNIIENDDGSFAHSLSITLPLQGVVAAGASFLGNNDLCGMSLLWAHANPESGTSADTLGYHGSYRGVLGNIECPIEVEDADVITNPMQSLDASTSVASLSTQGSRAIHYLLLGCIIAGMLCT